MQIAHPITMEIQDGRVNYQGVNGFSILHQMTYLHALKADMTIVLPTNPKLQMIADTETISYVLETITPSYQVVKTFATGEALINHIKEVYPQCIEGLDTTKLTFNQGYKRFNTNNFSITGKQGTGVRPFDLKLFSEVTNLVTYMQSDMHFSEMIQISRQDELSCSICDGEELRISGDTSSTKSDQLMAWYNQRNTYPSTAFPNYINKQG